MPARFVNIMFRCAPAPPQIPDHKVRMAATISRRTNRMRTNGILGRVDRFPQRSPLSTAADQTDRILAAQCVQQRPDTIRRNPIGSRPWACRNENCATRLPAEDVGLKGAPKSRFP